MLTVRGRLLESVAAVSGTKGAFDQLETAIRSYSEVDLKEALFECGVIPESFGHDSSEEKLWAKVCDIILAMALSHLGVESEVIRARGNSADVFGKGEGYTLVGDAKAFRLSRTAKNQKDFKITALDDWRTQNTFACLVAPLKQYPNTRSQIYSQAIAKNVTLASYTHLRFLLDHGLKKSLDHLWTVGKRIPPSNLSQDYWKAVDAAVLDISVGDAADLQATMELEITKIKALGTEGIDHWKQRIAEYQNLSKDEAITQLVKAEKITEKIQTIQRSIA